jgi:hypothetical protein
MIGRGFLKRNRNDCGESQKDEVLPSHCYTRLDPVCDGRRHSDEYDRGPLSRLKHCSKIKPQEISKALSSGDGEPATPVGYG